MIVHIHPNIDVIRQAINDAVGETVRYINGFPGADPKAAEQKALCDIISAGFYVSDL